MNRPFRKEKIEFAAGAILIVVLLIILAIVKTGKKDADQEIIAEISNLTPEELQEIAGPFVMKNPAQIKKDGPAQMKNFAGQFQRRTRRTDSTIAADYRHKRTDTATLKKQIRFSCLLLYLFFGLLRV